MNKLSAIRWDVHKFGLRGAAMRLARSVAYHLSPIAKRDREFDRLHGVETDGEIHKSELLLNPDSLGYYGTRPSLVEALIKKLPIDRSKFTFVDIGCGKGRPLIVAHQMGFKHLVGVEMSPTLAAIARKNTERIGARIANCDACEAFLPRLGMLVGPQLVVYMYNPFGNPTMRKFIRKVEVWSWSVRAKLYVIYVNPFCEQPLADSAQFKKIHGIENEYAIYESL